MTNTSRRPLPTILAMSPVNPASDQSQGNEDKVGPGKDDQEVQSSVSASNARPHPCPELPKPKLRIKCQDLNHEGSDLFFETNNAARCLSEAVRIVLSTLYSPSRPGSVIPPTRSITLVLREMGGVAYTTGIELDNDHKEIHFSLNHITNTNSKSSDRTGDEIRGVVVHEMVHAWQWNGKGTAPGGLIEGIADFVRLRAGLSPPHWKKEIPDSWDAGYQHTAYFLDWLEQTNGAGTVQKINMSLMDHKYDQHKFWRSLLGKDIDQLFEEYKSHLQKKESADGPKKGMDDVEFWDMVRSVKGDEMMIVLKARWRVQRHGYKDSNKDYEALDAQLQELWAQYSKSTPEDAGKNSAHQLDSETKSSDDDDAVLVVKDDGV